MCYFSSILIQLMLIIFGVVQTLLILITVSLQRWEKKNLIMEQYEIYVFSDQNWCIINILMHK